jgi:hypothetical protein
MENPENFERGRLQFIILVAFLVCLFLWRVFVPAHEYLMRRDQIMWMIIDGCLLAGLIVIGINRLWLFDYKNYSRTINLFLFWAGVFSGVGLFIIRLTSKEAWWTGHLFYSLLPSS